MDGAIKGLADFAGASLYKGLEAQARKPDG